MSTKIYDGYRLPYMSASQLLGFIMKVREEMKYALEEETLNVFSEHVIDMLDSIALGLPIDEKAARIGGKIPYACWQAILNRHNECKKTLLKDPECDFSCSIVLFPIAEETLAIFYSEKDVFRKTWESFAEVSEYAYWNNSDQPEDLSDEQWKERGDKWDKVLSSFYSIPSLNGLTAELVEHYPIIPDLNKTISKFPTLEERVKDCSRDLVVRNFIQKRFDDMKNNGEKPSSQQIMRIYQESISFLRTPEGEKEKESFKQEVLSKIKPNFKIEDIQIDIPERIINSVNKCCGGKCSH